MTLRTRLLLALGALLALALVVSGALVVGITRASLVAQLDSELLNPGLTDVLEIGPDRRGDPGGRRFALLVYNSSGELVEHLPSGFARAPDPLPALSADASRGLPVGPIFQRESVDGSMSYRLRALNLPRGLTLVLGAPMDEVEASIRVLIRTLALVGVVVLVLALVFGWLIIRRDLRPLEQITTTAERISAGDLSQRVGVPDDGSEIGRLGRAFDTMLDQIQHAFDSQHAALSAKERSESQLRQFVADASHELRTPLTALRGYSDLYQGGGLEERAEIEKAMTRIGSESRRMAALVEDLLLLARLDQGRPLRRDTVDLASVVNDALDDLRAVEPDRPVSASVEAGPTVAGDEDRLRQVVGNLLTNVRVHTPPTAAVEVSLTCDREVCRLSVADHGPGIDPAHVAHVFDRFYRADIGRSRDRGGSGLGLSIALSVATAHGGSISHSVTPGGGATFTLTLPRA